MQRIIYIYLSNGGYIERGGIVDVSSATINQLNV